LAPGEEVVFERRGSRLSIAADVMHDSPVRTAVGPRAQAIRVVDKLESGGHEELEEVRTCRREQREALLLHVFSTSSSFPVP
jgi:hypothetical protein